MGFEQVGHECVGHVEWDKYAQASYAAIYGQGREEEYANEFNGWDITTIAGADLPRADLWNFGAPCQDFSMAGKRAGLGGERSSLVQEVFRLYRETAEENRPTYLIYENVKGMLSSNGGRVCKKTIMCWSLNYASANSRQKNVGDCKASRIGHSIWRVAHAAIASYTNKLETR